MVMPSRQQLLPIQLYSCLLFLPHHGYLYRIYIDNPPHSLLEGQALPSTHLLLVVPFHPTWFSLEKECGVLVVLARLPDSAGWLYVDSQNLGNNGHLELQEERQLRVNEWVHLPTDKTLVPIE